jgi:hypothetical protein
MGLDIDCGGSVREDIGLPGYGCTKLLAILLAVLASVVFSLAMFESVKYERKQSSGCLSVEDSDERRI